MPRLVDPWVEERTHVLSGRVLDRLDQVNRFYAPGAMAAEIEIHRTPPRFVAEQAPEHMEDDRSLFIQVAVEEVVGVFVDLGHDGTAVTLPVFTEVSFGVSPYLVHEFVVAE